MKKIGCISKERYGSSASTYTELEPHLKELSWNEFKRCFRWNVRDDERIKKIYKRRVGRAFSYKLFNVRKTAKKPGYINQEEYDALKAYWATEDYKEKCQKAKENRASDSGGKIAHFNGAKPRILVEKKLREELRREPILDEIFFAQNAKENTEGQIEWANQKAEKAYNDYLANLPGEASNSEEGEPSFLSPEIQLQTWAQTQGVSNKGTVYELAGRASCVRLTRSTQNLYTQRTNYTAAPPDEQTIERLNYVENKLTSVLDSVEAMRAQHRAELEMQRMMYVQMLSATIQNQADTSSHPTPNFTNPGVFYHHQASAFQPPQGPMANMMQSGMLSSFFPHMSQPNTFPMFYNLPGTAQQPSQRGHIQEPNDTQVPKTHNDD